MTPREEILGRVREALRARSVRHATPAPGGAGTFQPFLAAVPESYDERRALFAANAEALRAEFYVVDSAEAVSDILNRIAQESAWKRIAAQRDEMIEHACGGVATPVLWVEGEAAKTELADCDAGVTVCEALVAQTGSVVITSRTCGGRALSVLPPHHVVIARREQLVRDLSAAYEQLAKRFGGDCPSFISVITGPSRTGDIEHVIVLGAHGPKRLTIVLVDS